MEKETQKKNLAVSIPLIDKLLLVIVPIAFIIVCAVSIVSTEHYRKSQIDNSYEVAQSMANSQVARLDEYMEMKKTELEFLTSFKDIYELNREGYASFLKEKASKLGFDDMFVVDRNGIAYYCGEEVERDQSTDPFFEIIDAKDFYVTDPFYTDNGPITTICYAINNPNGERVGTLCGKVHLDSIQEIMEADKGVLNRQCFILNQEGRYIASSNADDLHNGEEIAFEKSGNKLKKIQEVFSRLEDRQGIIKVNGTSYYSYNKYMKNYKWVMSVCIPKSNVEESYQSIAFYQRLLVVFLGLLLVAGIHVLRSWKKANEKMNTDELTGCGSRIACELTAERMGNKSNVDVTVMYTNVSKLKYVNETYGHDIGDKTLVTFAHQLLDVYKEHGFVARMGGDEFVVILNNMKLDKAQRLYDVLERRLEIVNAQSDLDYVMGAVCGYADRKAGEEISIIDLIAAANKNMNDKKHL